MGNRKKVCVNRKVRKYSRLFLTYIILCLGWVMILLKNVLTSPSMTNILLCAIMIIFCLVYSIRYLKLFTLSKNKKM